MTITKYFLSIYKYVYCYHYHDNLVVTEAIGELKWENNFLTL